MSILFAEDIVDDDVTTKSSPKKTKESGEKSRKKTKDFTGFDTFISKVLKTIHPGSGMSGGAMSNINFIIKGLATELSDSAKKLVESNGKKTINESAIKNVLSLKFPGELCKHAKSEAEKALKKYIASKAGVAERTRAETRAGLILPVARIEKFMKAKKGFRVSETSSVALTAVIEYIVAEILELSGNAARDNKRIRIKQRDILLVVDSDTELKCLFSTLSIILVKGGVVPDAIEKVKHKRSKSTATLTVEERGHRFLPGTVAVRNIKKIQKSDELIFAHATIKRAIKTVCNSLYANQDKKYSKLRASDEASEAIQSVCENKTLEMIRAAYEIVKYAKKQTLNDKAVTVVVEKDNFACDIDKQSKIIELPSATFVKLANRAAVTRISEKAIPLIMSYFKNVLYMVTKTASILLHSGDTKKKASTLQLKHITAACQQLGFQAAF
jgi:histone H3/H4